MRRIRNAVVLSESGSADAARVLRRGSPGCCDCVTPSVDARDWLCRSLVAAVDCGWRLEVRDALGRGVGTRAGVGWAAAVVMALKSQIGNSAPSCQVFGRCDISLPKSEQVLLLEFCFFGSRGPRSRALMLRRCPDRLSILGPCIGCIMHQSEAVGGE